MNEFDKLLGDLENHKNRSDARKKLTRLGAEICGDKLLTHLQSKTLPDNAIWAIVEIFTNWRYNKAVPVLINLLNSKPHLISDISRALSKITNVNLGSNAEAWATFLDNPVNYASLRASFAEHEISSFSIQDGYCKIILPTERNRKHEILVYEKNNILTIYTECGYIANEQVEAVKNLAAQVNYAKLDCHEENGHTKVSLTAEWGNQEIDFKLLKEQIIYFANFADDLENQLTSHDKI
jgi:hypothetical protein